MSLIVHCGAEHVSRDELRTIEAPEGTSTWHPIAHEEVLCTVEQSLRQAGFEARKSDLAVSERGLRFFGVLDLESQLVDGVSLTIGVRNSNDKRFPISFCAGSRTLVCDNLAFTGNIVIAKRHTINGRERFNEGVATAVQKLTEYQTTEAKRIESFQATEVTDDQAHSIILQAWEKRTLGQRMMRPLLKEWREPSYEEFEPRTAWSLLSAYTHIMKERQAKYPNRAAAEVMKFQSLLPA